MWFKQFAIDKGGSFLITVCNGEAFKEGGGGNYRIVQNFRGGKF